MAVSSNAKVRKRRRLKRKLKSWRGSKAQNVDAALQHKKWERLEQKYENKRRFKMDESPLVTEKKSVKKLKKAKGGKTGAGRIPQILSADLDEEHPDNQEYFLNKAREAAAREERRKERELEKKKKRAKKGTIVEGIEDDEDIMLPPELTPVVNIPKSTTVTFTEDFPGSDEESGAAVVLKHVPAAQKAKKTKSKNPPPTKPLAERAYQALLNLAAEMNL